MVRRISDAFVKGKITMQKAGKKTMQFTQKFKKRLNWLFANVGDDSMKSMEITTREYTLLSLIHLVNLEHILKFSFFIWTEGAGVTLFCYTVITMAISMPIYMIFMFMASYSKKSYIVFWDCVPLMRGLGYIYALISIPDTFSNVTYGGMALAFIYQSWNAADNLNENCAKTKHCVTENYFDTYRHCNESEQKYTFPMMVLQRRAMQEVEKGHKVSMIIGKITIVIFMFMIAAKGFSKIKKTVMLIQVLMITIFAFSFIVTAWVTPSRQNIPFFKSNWHKLYDYQFWLQMMLEISQMSEIGNLIWLSTFKPRALRIDNFTMYLHFIKISVMHFAIMWISNIFRSLNHMFNMDVAACANMKGVEVAFALPTQIFATLSLNKLLIILWCVAFIILQLLTSSYRLMALVDSLVDAHRQIAKYRFCISLGFLLMFLIIVSSVNTRSINYGLTSWSQSGRSLVFALMFCFTSIGINYIYSVDRLVNDFHFTYGEVPRIKWIVAWKSLAVIAMIVMIHIVQVVYRFMVIVLSDWTAMNFVQVFLPLVIILPCLAVFIKTCVKNVVRHSFLSATVPNERWGPYSSDDIMDRLLFVPVRDLKYRRSRVVCDHACLLDAEDWLNECMVQRRKLEKLSQHMNAITDVESEKIDPMMSGRLMPDFTGNFTEPSSKLYTVKEGTPAAVHQNEVERVRSEGKRHRKVEISQKK